ncbi:OmpA1 [Desulforapulum autotrophicum HRM2]|uniref:OmpA1 n=1 Tax=Desulforapulum autotrophicum (strain ATCC 43914 / DSM 3382 / VKM B-1955 / HRM2) TaxID=177437 RepID=C0QGL5_DESAH|nr:OmpA family protein [Desulforapulum autotrophicum]ACN13490.1 OmpA1 [Desulforapulum autotrophicum HRM2]
MKFFKTMFALSFITALFIVGCAVQQPVQPIPDFSPTTFNSNDYVSALDNFLIILDASSSMDDRYNGNKKFVTAREIVKHLSQTLPELGQNAGLRSFGHSPKVSDKLTVLFYGMEEYTQKGLNEKSGLVSRAGGTSPMHTALTAAREDLKTFSGKTAVVIISDGQEAMGLKLPITLEAAQALKNQMGEDLCFYPIFVGDDEKGMHLMEEIANIGKCGFVTKADKLMTGSGMGQFVQDVFLTKKPMVQAPAPTPIVATPPAVEKAWVVGEAYFDFDKSIIKPAGFEFLDKVVDVLKSRPALFVKIQGHTDSIGTRKYNDALSLRRAKAVKTYLINKGIDKNRLSCEGFAFSKPVASNKTAEGRAMNRRVELYPVTK